MIKIDLLEYHQYAIPQMAKLWHQVLGSIWAPDISIEHVEQRFHEHLNHNTLPLTQIAFHNEVPIGMCSLRANDGIRPDLKPWLGSLVVDPDFQKQGIGKLLIDAAKQKATELGFEQLYLFTFDPKLPEYYHRLGWVIISMDRFKGHVITLMSIDL